MRRVRSRLFGEILLTASVIERAKDHRLEVGIDLVRPALAGAAARFPTDRHLSVPPLKLGEHQ
jgi:hypothetical protein